MTFHSSFSSDAYALLDPLTRWVPGDDDIRESGGREKLIPPLVHHIRCGVKAWRDKDYVGASATTRALLTHWFKTDHWIGDMTHPKTFQWYMYPTARTIFY